MSGFVYIWRDRKKNRFYIGSHWGSENDGYICSSTWMKQAYNKRPQDFKRRILSYINTTKKDLLEKENQWQQLIKESEIGNRYYNLKIKNGHWTSDSNKLLTIGQKISLAHAERRKKNLKHGNKGIKRTEEQKEKIRQTLLGRKLTEEHKANIKKNHNRDYSDPKFLKKMKKLANNRSPETLAKIAANSKRLHSEGRVGRHGSYRTEQFALYNQ